MVITSCENLAVAPQWWEALSENDQEMFRSVLTVGMNPLAPTRADYLVNGLEGIGNWNLDGEWAPSSRVFKLSFAWSMIKDEWLSMN